MTDGADRNLSRPRRPWTVRLPAAIACGEALLLGTVGRFFVGFGLATSCTDFVPNGPGSEESRTATHCDPLYHWLAAGAIGQFVLDLVLGRKRPAWRRPAAIIAWALIPVAFAWIVVTTTLGSKSF
jgi:hypothetical protein